MSPLLYVLCGDSVTKFKEPADFLFENGADVNAVLEGEHFFALFIKDVKVEGSFAKMRWLVEHGCDFRVKVEGRSLSEVAEERGLECVEYLKDVEKRGFYAPIARPQPKNNKKKKKSRKRKRKEWEVSEESEVSEPSDDLFDELDDEESEENDED